MYKSLFTSIFTPAFSSDQRSLKKKQYTWRHEASFVSEITWHGKFDSRSESLIRNIGQVSFRTFTKQCF